MIVQSLPEGAPADAPRFIIRQPDHSRVAGQFARHFGNSEFEAIQPHDPMMYVVAHHDDGWTEFDDNPLLNLETGLPYHLSTTPTHILVNTGRRSPDANEAYHPYAGILSSMHTWGLYHGRYGLSQFIYIDKISAQQRPNAEAMLDAEIERQQRLVAKLKSDPELAVYVEQDRLFHNYKLLQFFDTLALHIQTIHPDAITDGVFKNVPKAPHIDAVIDVKRVDKFEFQVKPWCFKETSFSISTPGRWMKPLTQAETPEHLGEYLRSLPLEHQTYTFYAGL